MSSGLRDEETICGLTVDERSRLRRGLDELPETPPPRIVWDRIRAQAEAEGLMRKTGRGSPSFNWLAGLAIAASVVMAVILLPRMTPAPSPVATITEAGPVAGGTRLAITPLQALMVESQQLESDLRAMPAEPKVMRAGTVATISDIEDTIAAIDYQLADSSIEMTAEERELFWRERVRLMKSLLSLRYAQAQRNAF